MPKSYWQKSYATHFKNLLRNYANLDRNTKLTYADAITLHIQSSDTDTWEQCFGSGSFWTFRIRIRNNLFGSRSGSGYFHQQANTLRETLVLCDFSMTCYLRRLMSMHLQLITKKLFFCWHLGSFWRKDPYLYPRIQGSGSVSKCHGIGPLLLQRSRSGPLKWRIDNLTLLNNRKPGHHDKVHAAHIISQPRIAFTGRNT